ncbi:MAG: leucine-rich repeat protein, partial [Prevotella sp.]
MKTKRHIRPNPLGLLVGLLLLFAAATVCHGQSSTSTPPVVNGKYRITTAEELYWYCQQVNKGKTSTDAYLDNDITLTMANWPGIGTDDDPYTATFEGNNHTIYGLKINDGDYKGLFGYMKGGIVQHLYLNNPQFDYTLSDEACDYVGSFCGFATEGSRHSEIIDCHVKGWGFIRGVGRAYYYGGICGKADMGSKISGCTFYGKVFAKEEVGGIVGQLNSGAKVRDCVLISGSIVQGWDDVVGGIAGYMEDGDTRMENCYVQSGCSISATENDDPDYVGELVGRNNGAGVKGAYTEDYLSYYPTGNTVTGEDNAICQEVVVTDMQNVSSLTDVTLYTDIGEIYNYFTSTIRANAFASKANLRSLTFGDNNHSLALKAHKYPSLTIENASFVSCSNFEGIYMKYKVYAGTDHTVMLHPGDVMPGSNIFTNCPNTKIYVDWEYYNDFINDSRWKVYNDRIVGTTSMREPDFTEYGVKYARDNNTDAECTYQTTTSNNGKTTVYKVHVTGPDVDYIKSHDGIAYLYKDIGQTWAYTTTKIWTRAFDGCSDLKEVQIYDIMPSATENFLDLNMAIGDYAFANCPNLKYFNMVMNSVDETDHYEVIHPSQMPIGNNVFDGSPNVVIRIPTSVYSEFVNDAQWSQYKQLFQPYDFNMADYKEGGAVYSYWRTDDGQQYYSSENAEEMEAIVTPWAAEFRNLEPHKLLEGNDTTKTYWYVHITGADDDYLKSNDGEMRIYNDIGTAFNYKAIAVDSLPLRDNLNIKKIVFEDCASNVTNAHAPLKMVIHNGAFKGCKNLKELNMFYLSTEGTNKMEWLSPSDVYIGENVFDGVSEDFRIVVAPDVYSDFMNDANWSQYKDFIIASDYMPTTYNDIVEEGVTYGYASNTLNSLSTNTVAHLQSSLWNIAVMAGQLAIAAGTVGTYIALTNAVEAGSSLASAVGMGLNLSLYLPSSLISMGAFKLFNLSQTVAFNLFLTLIATQNVGLSTVISRGICNTIQSNLRHNTWKVLGGQWVLTENKHTIYHLYVKDIDASKKDLTIYNDIGTAWNYSTVGFGQRAFHNKTNLERIGFKDQLRGDTEARQAMCIAIPDSCFLGCKNLRTLDLVLQSNEDGSEQALGPDNFILLGNRIFEGCDTTQLKIRIGRERYDDFLASDSWSRYKNMFEVVDVADKVSFTENGVQYAYEFENASRIYQTWHDEHTIEHLKAVGGTSDLRKKQGEVSLYNDIGAYNNYKLDRVKYKAFYNNDDVKGVSFWDLLGAAGFGDAYTDLNVTLQDSCFADCKNLEYVNMLYMCTDGKNTAKELTPDSVHLGTGVFDGSDKLRIKMMYDVKDKFLNDSTWAKYADRFMPCFFKPADEEVEDALDDLDLWYKSPIDNERWDVMDASKTVTANELRDALEKYTIKSFGEFKAFESNGMTSVAANMFKGQKELQCVKLPSTITTIFASAFKECTSLPEITIPASVTRINSEAFMNCSSLRTVIMEGKTPCVVADGIFSGLPEDFVVYVPNEEEVINAYKTHFSWEKYADHIQGYTKKASLKVVTLTENRRLHEELGLDVDVSSYSKKFDVTGTFSHIDSLKVIGPVYNIDMGVIRTLGGRTPVHCNIDPRGRLKYLDLSEADLRKGDNEYFYSTENYGVIDVMHDISDDVVGLVMFEKLPYLETLILPNSAKSIKDEMAWRCPKLKRIVFGPNINDIEEDIIQETPSLREMVFLGPVPQTLDKEVFYGKCSNITVLTTNEHRPAYTATARFYNSADSIASGFEDDKTLLTLAKKQIYTVEDLFYMQDFENCVNGEPVGKFNELMYAAQVKTLGDNSLSGCSEMEEVALPFYLEEITAGAFKGCSSLKKINATCDTIPTLAANAFEDLDPDFVIVVPTGREDAWREAWAQYADHIYGYRSENSDITEVTLTEAGTLGEKLGLTVPMDSPDDVGSICGDYYKINGLKVNGPINGKDIAVIRLLGGRDEEESDEVALSRMTYLDLYNAEIKTDPAKICYNRGSYNDYVERDNEVPENMFWKLDNIRTLILPKNATKINEEACYDMLNVETIVVGDNTTYIDDDAFGECPSLKNLVFLCKEKPTLHDDAFTDPASDNNFQVKNMYVPKGLVESYQTDKEYTQHSMNIWTKFGDDDAFRAYGRNIVMTDDDLKNVKSVTGWFENYNSISDLTSLAKTSIDTLKATTFAALANLQKVTLPSTLTTIEANAFSGNNELRWADFMRCADAGPALAAGYDKLGISSKALAYMPASFGSSDRTNVVYGAEGSRECAHFAITDSRDYCVPIDFTAKATSYDRVFKKSDKPYTLCLPYDSYVPENTKVYTLSGRSDEQLIFAQVTRIEANKPYIV